MLLNRPPLMSEVRYAFDNLYIHHLDGKGSVMEFVKKLILPFILLAIWWALAEAGLLNPFLMPAPGKVLETAIFLAQKGLLYQHLTASLYRVLFGFLITFIVAFPFGAFLALHKKTYYYLEPILEFVRHLPPIALIPVLILWLGIGELPKLAVIILASFFPVFLNTMSGISGCDDKLLEVGRIFAFTEWEQFFKIRLPQAMPQILLGMQLGLGYSWRSLIGAELIAASSGIGYMIMEAEQLSRPDIILVGIFSIGLLGYFIDLLFLIISEKLFQQNMREDILWPE